MSTAELLQCRDVLLQALHAAMEEREQRTGMADSVDRDGQPTSELAWIVHEREVMAEATNRLRADRGLPPADRLALIRAEGLATGHCDYDTKFALYCAEYATGAK
ncbi:hypothetical protein [Paenarthrobacter sp. C1]|uniref:hypothetical protein n=1 Tax=Paenarthrobacter sp. C1 TaxID=3400220 RepID=UPI003BF4B56A